VLDDLDGRVDVILDGGPTRIGVESTVLDLSGGRPTILRPGGISREALESALGQVALDPGAHRRGGEETHPASPGRMERHYSPRAKLILFRGPEREVLATMGERVRELSGAGKTVGLLVSSEDKSAFDESQATIEDLGSREDAQRIATRLFAAMRALDARGIDVILVRGFGATGLNLAIEDRLTKASGGRIVEVPAKA
jgi:L-threonylcarbamoyladenylate synthase